MPKVVDIDVRKHNARTANLWRFQMLTDRKRSLAERIIGLYLVERLDKDNALLEAIVSRETIAQTLGMAERTVSRSIVALADAGHVKVIQSTGRGNANRYQPVIIDSQERDADPSPFPKVKRDAQPSPFGGESVTLTTAKCDIDDAKGVLSCHPLLYDPDISPDGSLASSRAREATPQAWNQGARESAQRFAFKDRGRYQRDLANRLPGDPRANMVRLSALTDDRLTTWCRQQRNAPERVDLDQLEVELLGASLDAQRSGRV